MLTCHQTYAAVEAKISCLLAEVHSWHNMANPKVKPNIMAVNSIPEFFCSLYKMKTGPIRKPVITAVNTKATKRSNRGFEYSSIPKAESSVFAF